MSPSPSATVIVLRPGPQVLLLRRHPNIAFHGGDWVFPGGQLDPVDEGQTEIARARKAAAREAGEEAGLDLDPSSFLTLSHWTTPEGRPKRYATWYFLALTQSGRIKVDNREILEGTWVGPAHALAARERSEIGLPPPTFVTLSWLADRSVDEIVERTRQSQPPRLLPRPQRVPGGYCSLLPGDVAYDRPDPMAQGPRHRSWLLEDGWRYEGDWGEPI